MSYRQPRDPYDDSYPRDAYAYDPYGAEDAPARGGSRALRVALIVMGVFGVLAICAVIGIVGRAMVLRTQRILGEATATATVTPLAGDPGAGAADGTTPEPTVAAEPYGRIVYTCFDGEFDHLCAVNADGSGQVQLTAEQATDWYASLAPDGSFIVFSTRRDGVFDIYRMSTDGTNPVRLTDGLGGSYAPEVSPDGTAIVFAASYGTQQDIYLIGADGSSLRRLTTDPADDIDPTWSPDGTRILFTSSRSGTNELYVMSADGSDVQQVTAGSDMRDGGRNDWSPDGGWIAFYAGERGDKEIYLVPGACAQGEGPCGPGTFTRLTYGGNNKGPSFSPDGQWITFATQLDGDNEIALIRVDGSELRTLTANGTADWQPRWGP